MEEKIRKLASTIVHYSVALKKGEKVLITYQSNECRNLVKALIEEIVKVGAICCVSLTDPIIESLLSEYNTLDRMELIRDYREFENHHYDAFIQIKYSINDYEGRKISPNILHKMGDVLKKVQDVRINKKRWVLLNYPSTLDAYKAKMKIEEFFSFAFDVMNVDYRAMSEAIKPLQDLMQKTDKVKIKGPNTDLTFSIKGMPAIPCTGDKNIPDGELYCAPVRDSVNGTITFNTPSPYQGNIFHHVSLTFENGKIIKATCDEDDEALNKIFDADEGAKYIGEFSLGFNPKILYPMGDILYDEKILGSFHFTPGRAYKDSYNGNDSSIHWDMVLIQREDFGGGEIYFDDVLIRKNGMFTLPELEALNYDYDQKNK